MNTNDNNNCYVRQEVYGLSPVPLEKDDLTAIKVDDIYRGMIFSSYAEAAEKYSEMPDYFQEYYRIVGFYLTPVMQVADEGIARAFEGRG